MDTKGFDNLQVVYEQFESFHYYLLGTYDYGKLDGLAYYFDDVSVIIHASQLFGNFNKIPKLLQAMPRHNIYIKYLSNNQMNEFGKLLSQIGFCESLRSENEVYYNVDSLMVLSGSNYSKLRNKKRNISKTLFSYKDINLDTIEDVMLINKKWRELNGDSYKKDRSLNENNLIRYYCDNNVYCGVVQYFDNRPTGYCLFDMSRDIFIQFITRGLNNNEGHKYSSTALYLKSFKIAHDHGYRMINDGDLGCELGTINHKMSFIPYCTNKTFDYVLQRILD